MDQNFMKEKKILPLVISMSLPMVISMAVNSLYNIVDSFFVARISEQNKSVNTISRLALSICFMVLIGQILSLNLIVIVIGFLCNHVSMVLNMGYILLRNRA